MDKFRQELGHQEADDGENSMISSSSSQAPSIDEIMKSIEKYVRLESNKKATVSTVRKLVNMTKEQKACFLCKQAVDQKCIAGIDKNFKPEAAEFDDKIKDARENIQSKVMKLKEHPCPQHG